MNIYKNDSIHELSYHIAFCTKHRRSIICDAVEIETKKILAEICEQYGWKLETLETMPDHVHLFLKADPIIAPAEIAKTLKSISAVYIFTKFPMIKRKGFWGSGLWSKSTYYGSAGNVSKETIDKYIGNQRATES